MQTPDIDTVPTVIPEDDPVLSNASLPLSITCFPLGFPVEIATNSAAVLAAARQSWGQFRQRFSYPPLKLRLGVNSDADASTSVPPAPITRARGHLMSHVADAYNFVHCDLNTGFAFGWITEQTAESNLYLRYFILEAAVLCMVAALRATPLHAACVSIDGQGMLLCGNSGAGKSSLAFAGARAGWTFTCDDASSLPLDRYDRMIIGNCHQIRLRDSGVELFPELKGHSITPRATGKPSIEILTSKLPGLITSESAIISSIVFLNRRNAHTPELVPFEREAAHLWLGPAPFGTSAMHAAQQASIRHLLEVPIFELRYKDLDWAIERLNTLARTGS
jgi:hypothetical protein